MMNAAITNGGPPTILRVTTVVTADKAYATLLPKLSERLLSMPSRARESDIKTLYPRLPLLHLQSLFRIDSTIDPETQYHESEC